MSFKFIVMLLGNILLTCHLLDVDLLAWIIILLLMIFLIQFPHSMLRIIIGLVALRITYAYLLNI